VQPLLQTHPHLDAYLLRGLVAVVSLGRHNDRFHEAARCRLGVGGIVQRDEFYVVGPEFVVEDVKLAAAGEPVVPGAEDAVHLTCLHQPAHLGQAGATHSGRRVAFILNGAVDFPATPQALGLKFFNLRVATRVIALGLLLGADAGVE